jgi:ribosome-associated heat shock protein Hsp15
MPDKVRIDKWLWSVRIFKTRTLAANAVRNGKVKVNGQPTKASYLIQPGERLMVQKNGFNLEFEVVDLIEKRVGAPLAQKCYIDHTPEEELNKYKEWFVGKARPEFRERGAGRPTKKERREIEGFKDWDAFDEEWEEDEA